MLAHDGMEWLLWLLSTALSVTLGYTKIEWYWTAAVAAPMAIIAANLPTRDFYDHWNPPKRFVLADEYTVQLITLCFIAYLAGRLALYYDLLGRLRDWRESRRSAGVLGPGNNEALERYPVVSMKRVAGHDLITTASGMIKVGDTGFAFGTFKEAEAHARAHPAEGAAQ
jgi:hypothetical protein